MINISIIIFFREAEEEEARILKEIEKEEQEAKKLYESGRTDRVDNWKKFKTDDTRKVKKVKHYVEKNMNAPLPQKMVDSHKYVNGKD